MSDFLLSVDTPTGPARVHLTEAGRSGLLCLGHGAGGGVEAPDLLAVRAAVVGAGWTVARVEQPYRVAGRRAPAPAGRLDEAWVAVVAALRERCPGPLVVGGRSSGARVACRTAAACAAAGVVCLAFPLQPPGRPHASRAGELAAVTVPVLVVQGDRDPFGTGAALRRVAGLPSSVAVVSVPGDHSLRTGVAAVGAAVAAWLDQRVA